MVKVMEQEQVEHTSERFKALMNEQRARLNEKRNIPWWGAVIMFITDMKFFAELLANRDGMETEAQVLEELIFTALDKFFPLALPLDNDERKIAGWVREDVEELELVRDAFAKEHGIGQGVH